MLFYGKVSAILFFNPKFISYEAKLLTLSGHVVFFFKSYEAKPLTLSGHFVFNLFLLTLTYFLRSEAYLLEKRKKKMRQPGFEPGKFRRLRQARAD